MTFAKWMVPSVAALALVLGLSATSSVQAAEKAGKGTVSGTVVDKDGKAVAGAEVTLIKPRANQPRPKKEAGAQAGAAGVVLAAAAKDPNAPRPEVVATTTTDENGKFEMKDVPAGNYQVTARLRGTGNGRAKVKVVADETATVEITLNPPKPKQPK